MKRSSGEFSSGLIESSQQKSKRKARKGPHTSGKRKQPPPPPQMSSTQRIGPEHRYHDALKEDSDPRSSPRHSVESSESYRRRSPGRIFHGLERLSAVVSPDLCAVLDSMSGISSGSESKQRDACNALMELCSRWRYHELILDQTNIVTEILFLVHEREQFMQVAALRSLYSLARYEENREKMLSRNVLDQLVWYLSNWYVARRHCLEVGEDDDDGATSY